MDQNTISEGKTMAIISYITVIGLLIAFIVNSDKKNEFVKFHIGQSLRVWILAIALSIVLGIIAALMGMGFLRILQWAPWILAIMGAINANNGKVEKLPIIGSIGE
ncbi:DUF4870 domain-containing protein [Arenibacter sp. BSSL-BM3]|uniref:DUF4870 domain-containing protein n=1 Tax=Arenibacter arenosicollis TaxID=2762274 RepID=A0ABR7QPN7_9FLAO|nr:DUF4870 domain-containing protein [Arenibacter arenosicollis]MBC8768885.1 DUF4870 domain-containing protein [Arenibacter arenosicollis]